MIKMKLNNTTENKLISYIGNQIFNFGSISLLLCKKRAIFVNNH